MKLRPCIPVLLLGLVALVLLPAPTVPTAQAATTTCVARPFRADPGRPVYYRIPALVATPQGTLLAFAERRRSTGPASDVSDTEIVLARSTDRGCHWSAPRVVADAGTDTAGNPVPVVDTRTGTVLLFSTHRRADGRPGRGLHLQRSTDDGASFTPYSAARLDLYGVPDWSGGLTGPGHAVQLRAPGSPHRGRIVVPLGFRSGDRFGAYGIVSDDGGASWKVGYRALGDDGRIEGTVAELPDGRLWISYRSRVPLTPVGTGRIGAFSSDGGSTLDAPFTRAGLPVVAVQGSALALTGRYAGTLLFSSPALPDPARRQRLALFASRGAGVGRSWRAPYDVQLDLRPASYSDLAQLDDDTLGVLYETGRTSWHEGITFRSLRLADVLDPTVRRSELTVTVPARPRAGAELRPTLVVRVPGSTSPAGSFRVRVRGEGVDRASTLPLLSGSDGRRVASLGTLRKGTYRLGVRYDGTARIAGASSSRTLTVR